MGAVGTLLPKYNNNIRIENMSYAEAMYFKEKSKQKALDALEHRQKTREQSERLAPNTSTSVASDNITFGKKHINSMAEALKQVNPKKWR